MDLLDRLGLAIPLVQAGMGGGAATGKLAGAVSAADALGTVGIMAPERFGAELRTARRLAPDRPVAANLITPLARAAHIAACTAAAPTMVVFHDGLRQEWVAELKNAGILVFGTVGDARQTRAALAAGVDGVIAQGVESGGHLVSTDPLDVVLPAVLDAADGSPVLAAGGVADAGDVRRLLAAGAAAAVAGTRFLLTEECSAHPEYKQRVLRAERTLRTELFGLGWPLAHRVVPNEATDRWCADDASAPGWLRLANRVSTPFARAVPLDRMPRLARLQRANRPMFSPALPLAGMPADAVDRCALYAGESALRMHDIVSAAEAVARLAP